MSLKRLIVPFLLKVFLNPFWRVGILLLFLNHYAVSLYSVTNTEAFLILHGWIKTTDWPWDLVSQNRMDEYILGVGLIEFFCGEAASCCFQIIVNLKECICLWLLLGDRNNLDSSYDYATFSGNSQFYFFGGFKSPGTICKLLDTGLPWSPSGQASQSLESDCT